MTAWPVWRGIRVTPVEAIQVGFRTARGSGLAPTLGRLPLPGRTLAQIPARNVLRTPRRTSLTVLATGSVVAEGDGPTGRYGTRQLGPGRLRGETTGTASKSRPPRGADLGSVALANARGILPCRRSTARRRRLARTAGPGYGLDRGAAPPASTSAPPPATSSRFTRRRSTSRSSIRSRLTAPCLIARRPIASLPTASAPIAPAPVARAPIATARTAAPGTVTDVAFRPRHLRVQARHRHRRAHPRLRALLIIAALRVLRSWGLRSGILGG